MVLSMPHDEGGSVALLGHVACSYLAGRVITAEALWPRLVYIFPFKKIFLSSLLLCKKTNPTNKHTENTEAITQLITSCYML